LGWEVSSGPSSANAVRETGPQHAMAITVTNAIRVNFIMNSVTKLRREFLPELIMNPFAELLQFSSPRSSADCLPIFFASSGRLYKTLLDS